MARSPRSALPESGFYHVVSRGTGGCAIYVDDDDRTRFVDLLATAIERHDVLCHAYCLMTTHYHLVVETALVDLSRAMARVNGLHAQAFNKRHERFGHLFADRFTSYVIDSAEHYERVIRYVLENPARAGLCCDARAWPWSGVNLAEQRGPDVPRPDPVRRGAVPGR